MLQDRSPSLPSPLEIRLGHVGYYGINCYWPEELHLPSTVFSGAAARSLEARARECAHVDSVGEFSVGATVRAVLLDENGEERLTVQGEIAGFAPVRHPHGAISVVAMLRVMDEEEVKKTVPLAANGHAFVPLEQLSPLQNLRCGNEAGLSDPVLREARFGLGPEHFDYQGNVGNHRDQVRLLPLESLSRERTTGLIAGGAIIGGALVLLSFRLNLLNLSIQETLSTGLAFVCAGMLLGKCIAWVQERKA